MDGRMPRHSLHPSCGVDKFIDFRVGIVKRFKFGRNRQRLFDGHVKIRRNKFCDFINILICHSKGSSNVTDCRSCGKGSEGYYLSNVVCAVFSVDVFDYLLPAFIAEVDIEVGHRNAFRVEESFEKKVIFYRVDVGDSDAVSADASCAGTSSGTNRDSYAFGVINKIVNNEVIVDVSHSFDYAEFIVEPFPKFRIRVFTVAAVKTFPAHTLEIFNVVASVRNFESRKFCMTEFKSHIAAVRDFLGIFDCFRNKGENFAHFLFGFYIKFVRFKSHIVIFINGMVRSDADKNVLHFCVILVDIVAVVGCNKRDSGFLRKFYKVRKNALLICKTVVLDFDKIVVFAENIPVFKGSLFCGIVIVLGKIARNFTRKTGGKRY